MTEILFHGGPVITVDDTCQNPEAVIARNGKIAFVGALPEARQALGVDHVGIDLRGRFLLPRFIDAHSHPLWAAKTRGAPVVDIRAETVPTYEAVLAKVERRVAVAQPGEHLLFFGLDAQLHDGLSD